jgi:hypothetical protein
MSLKLTLTDGVGVIQVHRQARSRLETALRTKSIAGQWLLTPLASAPAGKGKPVLVKGVTEDGDGIELFIKPQKSDNCRMLYSLQPVGARPDLEDVMATLKGLKSGDSVVATKAFKPAVLPPPMRGKRVELDLDFDPEITAGEERQLQAFGKLLGLPRLVPCGLGMMVAPMTMEPGISRDWLDGYNSRNRPIGHSTMRQFAYDMSHDNWADTPQGISFVVLPDPFLADGQTRLRAGIEEDVAFRTLVFLGLSEAAVRMMDLGRQRSVENAAGFCKIDLAKSQGIITWTMRGFRHPYEAPSKPAQLCFFEDHAEAFGETCSVFNQFTHQKQVSVAPVRAALVRAQYHYPAAVIERFIKCLMHNATVRADTYELNASLLADRLRKIAKNGEADNKRRYGLTSRAIRQFAGEVMPEKQRDKLSLRADISEQLPLPAETAPDKMTPAEELAV